LQGKGFRRYHVYENGVLLVSRNGPSHGTVVSVHTPRRLDPVQEWRAELRLEGNDTMNSMELPDRIRRSLAGFPAQTFTMSGFRRAAVLVPLVERRGAVTVVFTVRSQSLPSHAGQISFPGGQPEAGEQHARETALRESQEELGILPDCVDILGELDQVVVPSGFIISPVVGWLQQPAPFKPQAGEVDDYFEVPLGELSDPAHFQDAGVVEHDGREYRLPEYRVAGRRVWGATARIVEQLLAALPG
jgi:8-oxo-dGTP pyrophosphatase MutT (NUDIX family)